MPTPRYQRGRHSCKVRKYAHEDLPPDSEAYKTVVLGVSLCKTALPIPEPNTPDFTGQYEDVEGRHLYVCINQAGSHVELWVTPFGVRSGNGWAPFRRDTQRYSGYLENGRQYKLYSHDDPDTIRGSLGASADGTVLLELPGIGQTSPYKLRQLRRRATLSEASLASLSVAEDQEFLRRTEYAPLPSRFDAIMRECLGGAEMVALIQAYFDVEVSPGGINARLVLATAAITNKIHRELVREFGHGDDRKLAQAAISRFLWTKKLTIKHPYGIFAWLPGAHHEQSTRSLYDWFSMIYTKSKDVLEGFLHHDFEEVFYEFLALNRTVQHPYAYAFEYELVGVSTGFFAAGADAFVGELTIQQTSPTLLKPWTFTMGIFSFGAGSVGIKVHLECKGTGTSPTAWQENDFLGTFSQVSDEGGVAVGVGATLGDTLWHVFGDKMNQPMLVEWGTTEVVGLGLFPSISSSIGYIRKLDKQPDPDTGTIDLPETNYALDHKAQADAWFELGSAEATPEIRRLIRRLCAHELAALESKSSSLRIMASADRIDRASFNDGLTQARAKNVLQAMKDCVGPRFEAEHVETLGMGEQLAILWKDTDGTENPEARRVFIEIDGRQTGVLHGTKVG